MNASPRAIPSHPPTDNREAMSTKAAKRIERVALVA